MAWNQPGNNGQDRDPWGNKNNRDSNSRGNKEDRYKGPPDLESIFHNLSKKICEFKNIKKDKNGKYTNYNKLIFFIFIVLASTWAFSGFYSISPTDRGVVTSFGKFSHLANPGLNWKATFIDQVKVVNVEAIRELVSSGRMLTADGNLINIEINVRYQVTDPANYLYIMTNANDSLHQAIDSVIRNVIASYNIDSVLFKQAAVVRNNIQNKINNVIRLYNMGITLLDVNFTDISLPNEIKTAFNNVIVANEKREQYIREAEAYKNEIQTRANNQAQHICQEALADRIRTVIEAQGEVDHFKSILLEYKLAPNITKERLYTESMERLFSHTRKVLVSEHVNSVIILPLEQLMHSDNYKILSNKIDHNTINMMKSPLVKNNNFNHMNTSSYNLENIMDQRRANALRNNTNREGRK